MCEYGNYGKAELGDKRLGTRLSRLLEQLSSNPTASISAACKDPHQAKAAYRFIGNNDVTAEAISKIARDVTLERIAEAKPSVLLALQDTSEMNYSGLKSTEGLGTIGSTETSLGIHVHSSIALSEEGEVFGLLAQKLWTRPPEEYGKSKDRKTRSIEEKESYKWLETLKNVGTSFPENTLVVHVSDRESDVYEYFCEAEKLGVKYLSRRIYARKIEDEDGCKLLDEYIDALPVAGNLTVHVPRDSHTKRIARDALLDIKYGKCTIMKSSKLASNHDLPESIEVYVVSAVEINPPEGQEKIFWQLITNVPVESFEDAVKRIAWYMQRWKIEIFHRTLKSGCKVEELQSGSAEKLMKLITIYSIVALQIMLLNYLARTHPDKSCEICFAEEEWKILYRVANKTKSVPEKPPTVQEAVVMIAKLGGFLARKSDGFPGVTVIWRGLTSFYTIMDAVPFIA